MTCLTIEYLPLVQCAGRSAALEKNDYASATNALPGLAMDAFAVDSASINTENRRLKSGDADDGKTTICRSQTPQVGIESNERGGHTADCDSVGAGV